ncbi:diacylglycerol/lipid kinase family protein [Myceligenerans pegani]|uniref:NAD(+)/NADH kinase n=1 Tax=Myceligenerans pegani TaxID=2776917 RepID=A0ABR9N3U0_9MICO|nr:diacylglycerol kinase family protein [Myceligenerans sp. TRM 65318]MBE1878005.1 NAD(+)/NADH kinase [Myceligenerans sp. TRM 65318]MBE3020276.1 NAD(+)/NADH kinase [Myceligenerans sp. TRM 65318]
MEWQVWLGVAAIVIALTALGVALRIYARVATMRRRLGPVVPQALAGQGPRRIAVVVNPSKAGTVGLRNRVRAACVERGLPPPVFYETTVEDPGQGHARRAVEEGADVVVAAGGDGTVRAVAEALVGGEVPMGVIPVGTGNLLARNLEVSVTDAERAIAVVLDGRTRAIDVGWLRVEEFAPDDDPTDPAEPPHDTTIEHIFLVIAGLGFDAAMVAGADPALKKRVGWMAYFVAGLPHLRARRLRARIWLDDEPPADARLRSIMIGNCGMLPGGITLLPDAVLDDGVLDVAAADVRGGVLGWAQLTVEVAMQGFGVRSDLPEKLGRIDHATCRRARVRVSGGDEVQVDGDPLGRAVQISARVEPAALQVRAP